MSKKIKSFGLFIALIFFYFGLFVSQSLAMEIIKNYQVKIQIQEDADLEVTEKIVYDFGSAKKHGIFRFIPVKYKARGGSYNLRISNIKVVDEKGNPYHFTVRNENKNVVIKIGQSERLVSGQKVYVISYKIRRAVNYFSDHDEIYWNAIGLKWPVVIQKARVEVSIPEQNTISKITCFYGKSGSQQHCFRKNYQGNQAWFQQNNLAPGEGLTVVVSWPKGAVKEPGVMKKIWETFKDNGILILPILILLVMFTLWRKKGKDPQGQGTIIAQFDVPDNLTPAEAGTIIDEEAHQRDIAAEVIQLAIQGYLKIRRTEKKKFIGKETDYELIKLKNADDSLKSYQKKLLDSLFKYSQQKTLLSSLRESFFKDFQKIQKQVYMDLVKKGYFPQSPLKVRGLYLSLGFLFLIFSFQAFFIINSLWGFSFLLSGIIIIVFSFVMPVKTIKGVKARDHILGLKKYLEVAEKDRIKFHNAPEKNPQLFEKLLPYAMVLGVEKEWAKQFKDIYRENPGWYEDNIGSNFGSMLLISSLNSFSSKAGAAFSSGHSSAAGGGSGFSGGGGGGFGGGGGGSW